MYFFRYMERNQDINYNSQTTYDFCFYARLTFSDSEASIKIDIVTVLIISQSLTRKEYNGYRYDILFLRYLVISSPSSSTTVPPKT